MSYIHCSDTRRVRCRTRTDRGREDRWLGCAGRCSSPSRTASRTVGPAGSGGTVGGPDRSCLIRLDSTYTPCGMDGNHSASATLYTVYQKTGLRHWQRRAGIVNRIVQFVVFELTKCPVLNSRNAAAPQTLSIAYLLAPPMKLCFPRGLSVCLSVCLSVSNFA